MQVVISIHFDCENSDVVIDTLHNTMDDLFDKMNRNVLKVEYILFGDINKGKGMSFTVETLTPLLNDYVDLCTLLIRTFNAFSNINVVFDLHVLNS